MKKQMLRKLLTTTASLMACALLIGNTISMPSPANDEGNSTVIELPSFDDADIKPEYSPLNDKDPWKGNGE